MLKEACVENFYNIPHVIKAGADRLELNNDLALGGTTPSYGVIKKSVTYADNFKQNSNETPNYISSFLKN